MRCILAVFALALLASGCTTSSQPNVTLDSASVDPTYFCPGGASNAHYDLHGTIRVHNPTAKPVTIESVTAQMRLAAVTGTWLEKIGDRYDAGVASFSPADVPAGSSGTVKVTIASACTSGQYGSGVSAAADYDVTMHVVTSAGTYTITAANQHEIVAA